jgi:hypothetical protein
MVALIDIAQLARTPRRMCVLEPDHLADRSLCKFLGVALRAAGQLGWVCFEKVDKEIGSFS